jgi:hypothetical protein
VADMYNGRVEVFQYLNGQGQNSPLKGASVTTMPAKTRE